MLKRSFICCYITCMTVPLSLEYVLFVTFLLTTIIQNVNLDSMKRPWRNINKFLMSTLMSLTPLKKCGKLKS